MIAIDWGTTSFRAYRLSGQGEIIEKRQSASGILAVKDDRFAEMLVSQIGDWMEAEPDARIVMSGMIGSRQGWREIDYVTGQPGIGEIAAGMGRVALADGRTLWLAPGYSCRNGHGLPDVMRGEETQILGACAGLRGEQTYCLPGTHSKWVSVADSRLTGFTTFMTGEVFDVMCRHSILGRLMTGAGGNGEEAQAWFDDGVQKAKAGIPLLSGFFGVRARALFAEIPEAYTKDYLSGLLIGHEIRDARKDQKGDVTLIGSGHLIGLYGRAIAAFGGVATLANEDLAAVGLFQLAGQLDSNR
ncbi:MAG: 2-dehydro-3-deoxygalactonokinase [Rhodospirillales bacterium]|nr:2-dehydro-3-deoxygalactonokinase [Rhodospirillales bacterium]